METVEVITAPVVKRKRAIKDVSENTDESGSEQHSPARTAKKSAPVPVTATTSVDKVIPSPTRKTLTHFDTLLYLIHMQILEQVRATDKILRSYIIFSDAPLEIPDAAMLIQHGFVVRSSSRPDWEKCNTLLQTTQALISEMNILQHAVCTANSSMAFLQSKQVYALGGMCHPDISYSITPILEKWRDAMRRTLKEVETVDIE